MTKDYLFIQELLKETDGKFYYTLESIFKILNNPNFQFKDISSGVILKYIINMNEKKVCEYLENLYLNNELSEDKMVNIINEISILDLFYMKKLDYNILSKLLINDPFRIYFINQDVKCFNELNELFKFLTI